MLDVVSTIYMVRSMNSVRFCLFYLRRNKRFTKSRLDLCTIPSLLRARLRFFDFLVRMCRLKDFWCVIFPVPVTLNLFLALEFDLTFGIKYLFTCYTLLAFRTGGHFWSLVGNGAF